MINEMIKAYFFRIQLSTKKILKSLNKNVFLSPLFTVKIRNSNLSQQKRSAKIETNNNLKI